LLLLPVSPIITHSYARDCSRKIKSAFTTKGKSGKPLTNKVIYGFYKDPANKNNWLVDPVAAEVVRRIYALCVEGKGTFQIAQMLHNDGIESPGYYLASRGYVANKPALEHENKCNWRQTVIGQILQKPEYAGHTVNFRTFKPSFKSKKHVTVPKDEWLIFPNSHEAIIPQETWDLVQKLRETKRRTDNRTEPNPLTGLMYCAQCGSKMYNHRGGKKKDQYQCSDYTSHRDKHQNKHCSPHYVPTDSVREILLDVLRKTAGYVREYEAEFAEKIREASQLRQGETVKTVRKQISKNEKRIIELEKTFKTLYDDRVSGLLTVERFAAMSADYEREQTDLREKNAALKSELDAFAADEKHADQFIELVRKYTEFEELTTPLINEFFDHIEVHEAVWSEGKRSGTRTQQIDVYLKYIGKFDVPETRPLEEIEAERIEQEKLDKRRASNRERMRRYEARKREAEFENAMLATESGT
jgi:hypothetical protein